VVHDVVRRHIVAGWTDDEWSAASAGHPVFRLVQQGREADAWRLLRSWTAAHEAGHALMGLVVGLDVREVVVAHLHEFGRQQQTIGYTQYRRRRDDPDPVGEALHCLAGIAGQGLLFPDPWCLDTAAWVAPGEVDPLRDEDNGQGGDAWEARALIRPVVLRGERFLGQPTVGGAMVAALEQAEALLLQRRGALLRLSGHLLAYGKADRSVIDGILALPE
jgi:hypothetical protein